MLKSKKFLSIPATVIICLMIFTVSVAAAAGDIKYTVKATNNPTVMDGIISEGEYPSDPVVLDGSGSNTEGGWVGEWNGEIVKYYFTWDASNLYIGITVEGDTTESQDGPAGDDWFRAGDMVQIGFNTDYQISGAMPVVIGIGFTADNQPVIRGDAYRSTEEGQQTVDITSEIKGYSTKYSASGINYCCEVTVPWHDYIFVNGLGRESEGSPLVNLSSYDAESGLEIGLWLVYVNDSDGPDATDADTCLRTDMTTGCGWVAEDMSSLALVLADADPEPVAEDDVIETAPAEVALNTTETAPQTSDITAAAALLVLVSAAGAFFLSKKR